MPGTLAIPVGVACTSPLAPESAAAKSMLALARAPLVGQRIEQRNHQLLARISDVQPVEAHDPRNADDVGERLHADTGLLEIDELIVHAQAMLARFFLVQRRGHRALDAGADQP